MNRRNMTAAGLAAIVLSAGVLAGCGSSSSDTAAADTAAVESVASAVESTATTASALTKDQYVAEANAICAKIDDTENALDSGDSDSLAQVQAQLEKGVAAAKEGVAELKALVPPADLQAAHDTFVSTSEDSIALFQRIVGKLDSGSTDEAALTADAKEALALEKKQSAAVKELGLSKCFTGSDITDDTDGAGDNDTNDGND